MNLSFIRHIAVMLLLASVAITTWAESTAYVSTYGELKTAIENVSVNNIFVTANIDVPCGTSGSAGHTDLTGASTAQLIINRSLTLQSQPGSKYVIKRVVATGANASALKSLIAIRGDGKGESGTSNLAQNTVEVSFTNIIIDGGANWKGASVNSRRSAAADAYDCSGRATIDIYLGATLNLEDGVVLQNGYTTKSDNSLLNDANTSYCFGGAVRVDYHNNTGGGTVNIKAGATIHDCTARGGYGGALGAYNHARLNLYGGTIYNCSADNGGAIACTYREASGYLETTAGTIRMYGGTISNCCAENGGALCTHGSVEDYVLGGTITSCSATYGGAICQDYGTTVIHTVDHNSGELTISNCTNNYETSTANTGGYHFIYLKGGKINVRLVYQVTFRDNNTDFAVLSVAQGTSLGEAFPAAPVNAVLRFLGWYNGNTQITSSTEITENITVTAKWGGTVTEATVLGETTYITTFYDSTLDYRLPAGALAYTAGKDGDKVVFYRIGPDSNVIPHDTAVIIVASEAALTEGTVPLTIIDSANVTPKANNILQGSDTDIAKPAAGTVYVLGVTGGVIGFYPFTGSAIPAGKAYYVVN